MEPSTIKWQDLSLAVVAILAIYQIAMAVINKKKDDKVTTQFCSQHGETTKLMSEITHVLSNNTQALNQLLAYIKQKDEYDRRVTDKQTQLLSDLMVVVNQTLTLTDQIIDRVNRIAERSVASA